MTSTFKNKMKKSSERVSSLIKEIRKHQQFNYGAHNKRKLKTALNIVNKSHLFNSSLLNPDVHKIHADNLYRQYETKLKSIKKKTKSNISNRFRFLTLIDSVQVLNVNSAIKSINKFRKELHQYISTSTGIWCLGVIEVEVLSMEMMRIIKSNSTESEARKLEVCENLLSKLSKKKQNLSSYFLIHFHGIVSASRDEKFDDFYKHLKKNKRWNTGKRQILQKSLSESYFGESKTTLNNLKHISRYITKGGNDWIANKAYLNYKLNFKHEMEETEDGWVSKNYRKNKILIGENIEEGIVNPLSMTVSEIVALAEVIDSMMNTKQDRTGYLVYQRSTKRKLTTTDDEVKPVTLDSFT